MLFSGFLTVYLLSLYGGASARVHTDHTQVSQRNYDFIIVGGGTAGSVLARRLTEDRDVTVLLIEAGRNYTGPSEDLLDTPYFVSKITPDFNWNYTTVPQTSLQNRTIPYPRGYVLGGSSSINFMFYTRGSSDDFNRFARTAGDDRWSWDNILPFILKSETLSAPTDGHDTTGQVVQQFHGMSGPLLTSVSGNPTNLDAKVLNTTSEAPEFPYNPDMNSGNPLGVGWLQSTIGNGVRASAATAFLDGAVLQRDNLDVLIGTHVTKVLQTGHSDLKPSLRGVELAHNLSSPRTNLTAKREVILSAGSIGTPQILMLSGIGDPAELKRLGIKTIVRLPDVGNNLQDHPFVPLQWSVADNTTLDTLNRNASLMATALDLYNASKKGPLANNPGGNQIGFFRLPENSSVLKEFGDPTGGSTSPHYELTFGDSFLSFTQAVPQTGNFFTMLIALVSPTSRGSVKLATASPFDAPLIDPGFLKTAADLAILTAAVKAGQRFAASPAWSDYIIAPFADAVKTRTDDEIQAYIVELATTFRHPIGTAVVSKADDNAGVVGPELLLKGACGLRIVDASVFPFIFGAHMQAPVYAIAERVADIIKREHGLQL